MFNKDGIKIFKQIYSFTNITTKVNLDICVSLRFQEVTFYKTRPKLAYGRQGLDWIVRPEYSFGGFSTSCFAPAALNSVQLVVRINHYTKKNEPFISKLVRMKRCKQTDATLGKLVVRVRYYKETNRQTQPSGVPNSGPKI